MKDPLRLRSSLGRLEEIQRSSIILNPVENLPFAPDIAVASGVTHGLYTSDKTRTPEQQLATDAQVAGRGKMARDIRRVYKQWSQALGCADVSMRVLSGLHAHIIMFMAMGRIGERVLLLPERAGGHAATEGILQRLGFEVISMAIDVERRCIDQDATLELLDTRQPGYVFVDRSEGLEWESFEWLTTAANVPCIYDASQYLTNVLTGTHPSPFDLGFDYLVATTHKNFPGPQKALLATKEADAKWKQLLGRVSGYVSNFHAFGVYAAGLTLSRTQFLHEYADRILRNAVRLEQLLANNGVPVVARYADRLPTHHVWILADTREHAFGMYRALERARIYVNFRKLPYDLGFGLRLGTTMISRLGIRDHELEQLAVLLRDALNGTTPIQTRQRVRKLAHSLWERTEPAEPIA